MHSDDESVKGTRGPTELPRQEPQVEERVVGDDDPPGQQRTQVRSDVGEGGSVDDVGGSDAVQTGRTDVAAGVDQGLELTLHLAARVEQHDADLHDAVRPRGQPCGLHVEHGNGHDGSSLVVAWIGGQVQRRRDHGTAE